MVLEGDIGVAANFGAAPGAATAVFDFAIIVLFVRRGRRAS